MGDRIQINRLGKRSSSHTEAHSRPRRPRTSQDAEALRDKLIDATVEVIAEGSSPRLGRTLALL